MKARMTVLPGLVLSVLFAASASAAPTKSEALTVCKNHVSDLYQGDVRRKVKKIKNRSGETEVQFKITVKGERFNGVCTIARNGEMTYTDDRATVAGS